MRMRHGNWCISCSCHWHVHHLWVRKKQIAGVGTPSVHLDTVCLPKLFEGLLHLDRSEFQGSMTKCRWIIFVGSPQTEWHLSLVLGACGSSQLRSWSLYDWCHVVWGRGGSWTRGWTVGRGRTSMVHVTYWSTVVIGRHPEWMELAGLRGIMFFEHNSSWCRINLDVWLDKLCRSKFIIFFMSSWLWWSWHLLACLRLAMILVWFNIHGCILPDVELLCFCVLVAKWLHRP